MTTNTEQLEKLSNSHNGWIDSCMPGNKVHYYFDERGAFKISLCGLVKPNKDLDDYTDSDYAYSGSIDNLCKRCLSRIKKLSNGDSVEIKTNHIFI